VPRAGPGLGARLRPGYVPRLLVAVLGADGATPPDDAVTNPRELCAGQPASFVRPCWYRSFLENRNEGFELETPADLESLCEGLSGLQRARCVTAASLIGPPDPAAQLDVCARLGAPSDAAAGVRGSKVQNLLEAPTAVYLRLIERCGRFAAEARPASTAGSARRARGRDRWRVRPRGLPSARSRSCAAECQAGARGMEAVLVTFS
jgi:hypothetical protein